MVAVPESIKRLEQQPWIAHMIRAVERYISRLGSQFAAATTYFSVLALVPVLMMAFSVTGFVLTVVQPELLDNVADTVAKALGSADPATREQILVNLNEALSQYWDIGLDRLVAALYTGAKWMGHLKNAVRTQWRPGFDLRPQKINIVIKTVGNLVLLLGLIIGMAVTFGLASLSTLPETREPWPTVRRGALLGSIALAGVQFLASFLISAFRGNPAAAIFGPVIVLMLFFNIFAQLTLLVAAWIATAEHEAVPAPSEAQMSAQPDETSLPKEELSTNSTAELEQQPEEESNLVPQAVAARSVRAGMGAGYLTGAATGVGVGAALAYVFSAAVRGRKKT
jgi:membrane protein